MRRRWWSGRCGTDCRMTIGTDCFRQLAAGARCGEAAPAQTGGRRGQSYIHPHRAERRIPDGGGCPASTISVGLLPHRLPCLMMLPKILRRPAPLLRAEPAAFCQSLASGAVRKLSVSRALGWRASYPSSSLRASSASSSLTRASAASLLSRSASLPSRSCSKVGMCSPVSGSCHRS